MTLRTKKLGKHWWITGDEEVGPMGPYPTKAEAEDDRHGLVRFEKHQNEPGYVTIDKRKENEQ